MSSSSRRIRRPPSPADELVLRLRALLPREAAAAAANNGKTSSRARRVLREACVYIRRLHAELDSLADQLARLLEDDVYPSVAAAAVDGSDAGAGSADELIRNLLT